MKIARPCLRGRLGQTLNNWSARKNPQRWMAARSINSRQEAKMNYTILQWMKTTNLRERFSVTSAVCFLMIACSFCSAQVKPMIEGETPQAAITLDPPVGSDVQAQMFNAQGHALPPAPANFRRLGEVKAGETGRVHTLTLRFAETLTLTHIKATKDFRLEQGGTCIEGNVYVASTTCTLRVRFTPQGPGNRLGQVVVSHTGSTSATTFSLSGYSYEPAINFVPSLITTVPGTFTSGAGLLNGAQFLSTDGGDRLFMADTNNSAIRTLDSSGLFVYSQLFIIPPPLGVTVDTLGDVWYTTTSDSAMREFLAPNLHATYLGGKTDACTEGTPACTLGGETLTAPGELSSDLYDNIFFEENNTGAAMSTVQPNPSLLRLYNIYAPSSGRFATDSYDDLYSYRSGECQIEAQTLNAAEFYNPSIYRAVAGTSFCGFSGDGVDARNAELSATVGQFAFDAVGDVYFTDTGNQRVRRIEYNSGIIRTIAGNGTAGYTGDGGKATSAELQNPTGVAVDSQGGVYVISGDGSTGSTQVVRKIGPQGFVSFGNQAKASPSAAQLVTVTNTGNSPMVLTSVVITGANAADFKIDNTTTTCLLTPGASLGNGQTCRIGAILTPSAIGTRTARLTLLDNTVNGADSVTLSGTGVLGTPIFKITSPANGASFASGTSVPFSVSVTSASGPRPTGTVQFKVDGVNFGSAVTLSSTGTASTSVTGLTTATHKLAATYSGDTNYAAAGPISVSITITAAATVKFISPTAGQTLASTSNVTLAVKVTASSGPTPTGTVKFSVDGTVVGTGTLVSGATSVNAGTLTAGTHKIVAAYSGNKYHPPAKASESITVQ